MKRVILVSLLLGALARPSALLGADPPRAGGTLPAVRVINFTKLFTNHHRLQREHENLQEWASGRRSELAAIRREEFRQQEEIRARMTDEQRLVRVCGDGPRSIDYLVRQELRQKEAELYRWVTRDVMDEVRLYCKYEGVHLILRVDRNGPPVVDDPHCIVVQIVELDREVFFYDPKLDITDAILREVNRGGSSPKAPSPLPQRPPRVSATMKKGWGTSPHPSRF